MADDQNASSETLERDIERTQDRIGETVDKIEQKLTPREITRTALGDDGQDLVREALRMTRENPVPVAMIAVGAIWLLATSGSPLVRRMGDRLSKAATGRGSGDDALRPRSDEPAPIGPPPASGEAYDRRSTEVGDA
jgi:hypothetical protein